MEDRLNRNPRSDFMPGRIARRLEFPRAHRLDRAFFQSVTDASQHPNISCTAIRPDLYAQRHRSLNFDVSRFVGVNRNRTIEAGWQRQSRRIRASIIRFTVACASAVANATVVAAADASMAWSARVCIHNPLRQAQVADWRDIRRRWIKDRDGNRKTVWLLVWKSGRRQLNHGMKWKKSAPGRFRIVFSPSALAAKGWFLDDTWPGRREQWRQRNGKQRSPRLVGQSCFRGGQQCRDHQGMHYQRSGLRSCRPLTLHGEQVNWRAIRRFGRSDRANK